MGDVSRVRGIHEARKQMEKLIGDLRGEGLSTILSDFCTDVQNDAMALAPVKSKRLQNNIDVHRQTRTKFTIKSVAINPRTGYNYAYLQHENDSYQHINGEAHYLEKALQRRIPDLEQRLRRLIDSDLR